MLDFDFDVSARIVDRILAREAIRAQVQLPYDVTSETFTDMVGETYVRLRTFVYAEKKSADVYVTVEVPATWWQHLVDSTFPKWYKKRFPVIKRTITEHKYVHFEVLYPEFKPAGNPPYAVIREVISDR